jgi:hypothetical protein
MMKPQKDELLITGKWIVIANGVQGDEACNRIHWLTSQYLREVATSLLSGGWETLFVDPDDNRYWERTYPQGEMHGGGPPQLEVISPEIAKEKYRLK